jgi:LacI family fructose operon transcriptional repressor
MPSIKDVAEAAGVSTATVSRVLSDHPHVRAEVRTRVLAVVEKLGYRPNLVARSLRSQQSTTLGLIVSDIRNPFFTAISRAVENTAYEHGFSVLLCNTDEDPEKEVLYLDLMRAQQVAGVIFSPTRDAITHFADLKLDVPTVLLDRSLRNGEVDAVQLDNVSAAYDLTMHLLEQGYRRIGALFGAVSTTGRERQQGYELALCEHGLVPPADGVRYVQPQIDAGREAALELLALSEPPDAIFTSNSLLTAGALQAIQASNLAIPDGVALVGFDETTWASLVQPAITLIAQPTDEIGKTATELLLQRIADPSRATRKVILQGELRVRGSSVPHSKLVSRS